MQRRGSVQRWPWWGSACFGLPGSSTQEHKISVVLAVLAVLVVSGCGGANSEDVALITGQPGATGSPAAGATATPVPSVPIIVPLQVTLFAGLGTPPSCDGGSQSFVVMGGSPPYTVSVGEGGCLSTTAVATSGGSFTFTAGNAIGDATVTVTDALGTTSFASISVRNPPAAFIKVDLVPDQRSDNGDGTFTSVVGALVTDASGVAVGDGVPVEFTLVNPVPGVSVTSPGLTGQAAPCTPGLAVVPQPGDALSCIKYAQSLQGSTVTIQARVKGTDGVVEDTRTVTLPDLRPPATPTNTLIPTATRTPTPLPPPAHIQVALFVNQASNNGDGTLTSVVSALVTDATGAVVGDGVPVLFSLLAPVPAGVSVTSPGLTGQAAPCTLNLTVVPQPGDALSCVKYDQARQGQTVTVQALVQTPAGPLTSTQLITLPDLRPTATPTSTPTFTLTLTPTPTETLTPTVTDTPTPAAAQIEVALFVNQASNNGDGTLSAVISALVTDATGAAVGNGVPVQFSLMAPVPAGVSVTSPGFTGQTAPCTLGFTVVPQPGDALSCVKYNQARQGQTVTVQALVQTPSGPLTSLQAITLPDLRTTTPTNTPTLTTTPTPTNTPTPTITSTPTPAAAHIQIALFVNQASSNGDGTLSSVISALVTDATGATVGNGVAVQFSLISPPAGVSVTSPGFTGQAAPCTLGFPVLAQPGDALSCVKYDSARQGEMVTVQASVQTPSGPLISMQVITLPDLRPTATPTKTPTSTFTVTSTPSVTPTPTPGAAHIQLALFVNQASSNGDGTLSTVISALVTDANGVTVGNGAPVLFSLLPPVPGGVSVTSPGFTGQTAPPCTLSFTVVPQPGDALSCIKYDQALQGQMVTVQALVQTIPGPSLTSSQVITLPDLRPTATPTPQPTLGPFALHFVSATPITIGVRASGLPEQSGLSFQLTDAHGNPVADFPVTFSLSRVIDESLNPVQTFTDANGMASTTLTGGTRAMTVQVIAGVDSDNNGSLDLFAQSTAVSIFGAPPVQNRFSMAADKLNVPGRVFFGVQDKISAFANDLFGNAVPPGTAVSFTSNGASVVNPTTTDANGIATATLVTEEDIPPTGIVTVLAFTRGEEGFRDNNANGVFDPGVDDLLTDNEPEPFIDFRPLPIFLAPSGPNDMNCPLLAPSPLCNGLFDPGLPFEQFVDANEDKMWDPQGTPGVWDGNILVFDIIPVTFSGHLVPPVVSPSSFSIAPGGAQAFTVEVHDDLLNPLVGGSTITVAATVGTVTGGSITVPDGESFNHIIDGLNRFTFVLSDTQGGGVRPLVATTISVTVTSANGSGTFIVASGLIPQSMPNATPTPG